MSTALRNIMAVGLTVSLLGCVHVPANFVTRDRFDYAMAIGDSWKRQTLANVVRMRYADAPVFLNVTGVINAYSLSSNINATAGVADTSLFGKVNAGVGGSGTWSNSPTVTYAPLTGEQFTKNLLRPIPPFAVLQLIQAGWPARLILTTSVRSISGIHNQVGLAGGDPQFGELVDLLQTVQQSDGLGFRLDGKKDGDAVVMVIGQEDSDAYRQTSQRIRTLLHLDPNLMEFSVVYGAAPASDHEVAMMTRSMFEVMIELAAGMDVPDADKGRVLMMLADKGRGAEFKPLVHIQSGPKAPDDAYAAIPYGDHWFWIGSDDVNSKRVFTFLMILFSLSESGAVQAAPLVTIPAGH